MSAEHNIAAIRSQMARVMEQTANISDATIESIELAARRISDSFANGGKLLVLASDSLHGLAGLFHHELIQQYKDEQPSLPVSVLNPFPSKEPLSSESLHEANTLAALHDCLLVLGDSGCEETHEALELSAKQRNLQIIQLCSQNPLTPSSEHFISVGINTDNIYGQRELSLFLLHCISDRIQSILFKGG